MQNKEKLIIANFKMTLNSKFELERWFESFLKERDAFESKKTKIVLCPALFHLNEFLRKIKGDPFYFGSQNCFWEEKGAFTGENSPKLLKNFGVDYVILGHSERRKYLKEDNLIINKKIKNALKAGLSPVLCIGENAEEKQKDATFSVIKKQFTECLDGVDSYRFSKIVLCYEPVWAISANGPSRMPQEDELMQARLLIRKLINEKFGMRFVDKVPILYGGSVKSSNIDSLCVQTGMNGALVGGASLIPSELFRMAKAFE